MVSVTFDPDEIDAALRELVGVLVERGANVRICVVGGAAIALNFGRELTTRDVDALYNARIEVSDAVATVAARHGWPEDWLNDNVKMYASHEDHTATWTTFDARADVSVEIAPADLLLAMKLLAGRGLRDGDDIDLLCDSCGIDSVAAAVAVFDRYYPEHEMSERARRQLIARFGEET